MLRLPWQCHCLFYSFALFRNLQVPGKQYMPYIIWTRYFRHNAKCGVILDRNLSNRHSGYWQDLGIVCDGLGIVRELYQIQRPQFLKLLRC
jgi:hypothetical protein